MEGDLVTEAFMTKLGLTAALLSALWLILAAVHNAPASATEEQDELQGMELEHFDNGADPSAWGRILEEHAASNPGA